jgi:hypothetical protein
VGVGWREISCLVQILHGNKIIIKECVRIVTKEAVIATGLNIKE